MKKLIILFLFLFSYSLFAEDVFWQKLKMTLPAPLEWQSNRETIEKALGTPTLKEKDWYYYSEKNVKYPLAIKLESNRMIGGTYQFLSPYKQVITLSSLTKMLSQWTLRNPEGHDFGRYQYYTSPDKTIELRFFIQGKDGALDSFKWGDWK